MSKHLRRSKSLAKAGLTLALLALLTTPAAAQASFSYHDVGSFGETGGGEGQFASSPIPQRIAVDPYGNVYVADRGNNRVEIFEGTEEGASFITKFTVTSPIGVAVDPNTGAVYTTRAGANEKQTITPPGSGTYTLSFEGQTTAALASGATNTQIQAALWELTKIGPANVYVNTAKEAIFQGGLGGQDVPQMVPSAGSVSTTTAGASGTLSKFIPFEAEYPPSFGTAYSADPEFSAPTGVAIAGPHTANSNASGAIAVDPTGANDFLVISGKTVKRFGANGGAALASFDGSGSGAAFNDPADLAIDPSGKVLVADITAASAARVMRFASDGSSASTLAPAVPNPAVAPPGTLADMAGISVGVDPLSGEAFVSSKSPEAKSPGQIYRYSSTDALIESFGVPAAMGTGLNGPITGIATRGAPEGSLYVISTDATGVPAAQVFKPKENFPLTLEIEGNGTLQCEVFGEPIGPCASEYAQETELAIIASPEAGWELAGFTGSCEGESCEVRVEEPLSVKATFKLIPPPNQPLNVGTTGSGAGEVLCKVEAGPEEPCESEYEPGKKVELIAKPSLGSEFVEWREDCTGTGACKLTMDKEHNVTAAFNLTGTTPVISAISPKEGSTAGGTVVTITGSNLSGATEVKWGAKAVTCAGTVATCKVESATEVKATSPEHAAGTVHVTVSAGASTSASKAADEYTYLPGPTVSGISPNKGTTAGATVVTITGTNLSGAEEVKFGATAVLCPKAGAPNKCVVKSATEIEVESPPHAAGEVDVTVKTPGGASATGAPDKYTFQTPAPTVSSVSPNKGTTAGGTVVTITGTNLSGAEEVKWGAKAVACAGTIATCKVESATEIKATSPAHAAGEVDLTVKTPGGTSATGAGDKFKFETPVSPPPAAETCATNPALCPPPPEETCATNPALCPPPIAGTAKAAPSALVKAGKAQLKLSCSGGACKGTLKLSAKIDGKNKAIGKASFSLAAGAAATLKVKLSAPALKVLKSGKALKAKLTGTGIAASTVKLKAAKG